MQRFHDLTSTFPSNDEDLQKLLQLTEKQMDIKKKEKAEEKKSEGLATKKEKKEILSDVAKKTNQKKQDHGTYDFVSTLGIF